MSKTHQLTLLKNSISFFREAVSYVQKSTDDTNHWKFAIINVVQAMELAFKEYLRDIHPTFIYESIDRPDKTISLRGAISRLRNPQIGDLPITDSEQKKIEKAVELRNDLTHYEFNHSHDHTELKFAEIFSFMIFFYREYLGLETDKFIDEEDHKRIIKLVRTRKELIERAYDYVSTHKANVWACPECGEDTFLLGEEQCCFCHHKQKVVECPTCGAENFESDLIDLSDDFDYDLTEGQSILIDNFEMEDFACPECVVKTRQKIRDARQSRHNEYMEMKYYSEDD